MMKKARAACALLALMGLIVQPPEALADPAGRTTTTSVWVDTSHWESVFVAHHDGFWINAYEPPGTGPHDHSGNHQAFCPSPGSLGPGEDPGRCHGNWHDPYDEYDTRWVSSGYWSTTTVALPPAAVSGAVDCVRGAEGWCVSPAIVTITGSEPVAGHSIYQIQGAQDSAPFTCPGSTCSFDVYDTAGRAFTYQAFSTFGDSSYAGSTTVKVDTVVPATTYSLSGASGANGWYVSPVTATLSSGDATSGVAASTLDGAAYTAPAALAIEGRTTHEFYSVDAAGNVETAQSFVVQIDTAAPVSAITSPSSGNYAQGTVTVTGTAGDTTSGVAAVDVSADGGATWQAAALSGGTWRLALDTTLLPDGATALLARARDVAGNVETVSPPAPNAVTVTVDNTIPALALAAPGSFCPLCGDVAALAYRLDDVTSGIADWSLAVDGGPTLAGGSAGESATLDWNGSSVAPGTYTLRLTATDAAGNMAERAASITIRLPAPPVAVITVTCPLPGDDGWCQAPVTVNLSGSVVGLPVAQLNYLYHDELKIAHGGETSFVEGSGGEHHLSLTVTDALGRISEKVSGSFKIDGGVPSVAFEGGTASSLKVAISDTESGVRRWTAQAFDDRGQSVFWKEGRSPFVGELSWSPARSGRYYLSIYARDGAGIEAGLVRQPFDVAVPAPASLARQVAALFATTTAPATPTTMPTATPFVAAPTPMPQPTAAAPVVSPVIAPSELPTLLSGAAFLDLDADGQRDPDEPGLAGVTIVISSGGTIIQTVVTAGDGSYRVGVARGKRYLLQAVQPRGLRLTTAGSVVIFENAPPGSGEDFGLAGSRLAGAMLISTTTGLLLAWALAAALDRRGAAVYALAEAIESALAVRAQLS